MRRRVRIGLAGAAAVLLALAAAPAIAKNHQIPRCETPEVDELDEFTAGTSVTVEWGDTGESGGFEVEYADNEDFTDSDTDGSIPEGATEATIDDLSDGETYFFRVKAKTKPNVCRASDSSNVVSTTLDDTPPSVSVDEPSPPVVIGTLDGAVTGTADDDTSGVASVDVTFEDALGDETTVSADCDGCGEAGEVTWSVSPAGLTPGLYTVTATATDGVGHTTDSDPVTLLIA